MGQTNKIFTFGGKICMSCSAIALRNQYHVILMCLISVNFFFFVLFLRGVRRQGQNSEKINRAMILLPVVGIIINLIDASSTLKAQKLNDLVGIFASMDCSLTILCGFQYVLDYNWVRFQVLFPLLLSFHQMILYI